MTSMDINQAAKLLGTGPRKLMAFLREQGLLHTSGPMKSSPKGYYQRHGYLTCELVEYHTGGVRHQYNKPMVTGPGLALIKELMDDMDWKQINRWTLESTSGHRVSKAMVEDEPKYSAWSASRKMDSKPLGIYATASEAKQRCEQDQ